ncbi:hypothetical protein Sjap_024313 [Stephania japonica]|uniref:Hexosyltransferase n=1 Tax=Stephania japonica TaxID=461633 RepID=A0AAP0ED64_9MAGN
MLTLLLLIFISSAGASHGGGPVPTFREAPQYRNGAECRSGATIHIAMALDTTTTYLRGSIAAVHSILHHAACPENLEFHFLTTHRAGHPHQSLLRSTLRSTFPFLHFQLLHFPSAPVRPLISSPSAPPSTTPSTTPASTSPTSSPSLPRVLYLDSDLLLVDDVSLLFSIPLHPHVLAAPEYCHANFSSYFTRAFWRRYNSTSPPPPPPPPHLNPSKLNSHSSPRRRRRRPCYFNTGVMVIDLVKWREGGYTGKLEGWMRMQKRVRIYELGSLPPFLLVFGGDVKGVEHRWNQHGLGGDNVEGLCRDLHPGPVSLLHWSGKGKPWLRLDAGRPCPLDRLWAPYDLLRRDGMSGCWFCRIREGLAEHADITGRCDLGGLFTLYTRRRRRRDSINGVLFNKVSCFRCT